jgi:hypothetical protein
MSSEKRAENNKAKQKKMRMERESSNMRMGRD